MLFQHILAIGLLGFHLSTYGEEVGQTTVVQRTIPYKVEAVAAEEQGWRTGTVLLILLIATGGGLYAVKKRMPKLVGIVGRGERLRLVESIRLDNRCRVYLVELDQRQLLIAQSGDTLVQLEAGLPRQNPNSSAAEVGNV